MSKGLKNPLVQAELVKQTASVLPFLIKTTVLLLIGWYLWGKWSNRFVKWPEKSNYPAANITINEAESKADSIEQAKEWFVGADFDAVSDALSGLNYNGFVRLYNAFGKRSFAIDADYNLIEWIHAYFSQEEINQLSILQNGVFFKLQASPKVIKFNEFLNQFPDDLSNEIRLLIQYA
jgi:hypothetical protein